MLYLDWALSFFSNFCVAPMQDLYNTQGIMIMQDQALSCACMSSFNISCFDTVLDFPVNGAVGLEGQPSSCNQMMVL